MTDTGVEKGQGITTGKCGDPESAGRRGLGAAGVKSVECGVGGQRVTREEQADWKGGRLHH